MSTTTPTSARTATTTTGPPQAPALALSPARARRRPLLVAAGVVAVCLGALVSVWAYTSSSSSQQVLAIGQEVTRGQVIERGDLLEVRTSIDPALRTIATSDSGKVVGQRAATDLFPGSLLTPAALTPALVPSQGQSVVGLALSSAKMPADTLVPGDAVRVISTPAANAPATAANGGGAPPQEVPASVVAVSPAPDVPGTTLVNVAVDQAQAAALAARAGIGDIAVVLDARES